MKKLNYLFPLFLAAFLINACQSERKPILPSPGGAPGEVLLVMEQGIWESEAGEAIQRVLNAACEGLPQHEPLYDIIQVPHKSFSKIFKQQRNIIVTKIGSDQPEPKIRVQKNLWAKTQLLISISAPTDSSFIQLINDNRNKIPALLSNLERKRLMDVYSKTRDPEITKKLSENYSLKLIVPKGYKMEVQEPDFVWLTHEYRDVIQGVFIYMYDYMDENTFTTEYLISKRDEFLKKNVPGEIEGSYMTTELLFPPVFNVYNLRNSKYTAELRGLWKMENGLAMGGPFLSLTQLDEKRNRIVTVEGFVFAPAHKKRDLVRQTESILLSIDFPEEKKDGNK